MDTARALRVDPDAGLGETVGVEICTLGDYWQPDRDERTGIGLLVHRTKDKADPGAAQELAERFASLARVLPEAPDGLPRLVVPVPSVPASSVPVPSVPASSVPVPSVPAPSVPASSVPVPSVPAPSAEDDRPKLADLLAASLAAAGAGEYRPGLLTKTNPTPRMRYVDPERRAEVVDSAGYRVREPVVGRDIVVVDDVVLTGTTLCAVAACLRDAGAVSVTAAVAARTRLS